MIHDIGFLIEANFEPPHFAEVLQSFGERENADDEHCVLAHGLAHYWSLPPWVKELLRRHHDVSSHEADGLGPMFALLHVSHAIAQFNESGIESHHLTAAGLQTSCISQVIEQRHQIFESLKTMQKG